MEKHPRLVAASSRVFLDKILLVWLLSVFCTFQTFGATDRSICTKIHSSKPSSPIIPTHTETHANAAVQVGPAYLLIYGDHRFTFDESLIIDYHGYLWAQGVSQCVSRDNHGLFAVIMQNNQRLMTVPGKAVAAMGACRFEINLVRLPAGELSVYFVAEGQYDSDYGRNYNFTIPRWQRAG